jgi:hypothetical protein
MDQNDKLETDHMQPGLPEELTTTLGDVRGTVFLIPLDAPLPLELADFAPEHGPLLQRLQPLSQKELTTDVALIPISGAELLAIARAWSLLREAKKVAVLADLPGARDDILFTQARRQIGLHALDWPSLADAFASRHTEQQRTKDKQPWTDPKLGRRKGPNLERMNSALPVPGEEEDDLGDLDDADS